MAMFGRKRKEQEPEGRKQEEPGPDVTVSHRLP